MAERMAEMESESLAKLVQVEGELVEARAQKEELESMHCLVSDLLRIVQYSTVCCFLEI